MLDFQAEREFLHINEQEMKSLEEQKAKPSTYKVKKPFSESAVVKSMIKKEYFMVQGALEIEAEPEPENAGNNDLSTKTSHKQGMTIFSFPE